MRKIKALLLMAIPVLLLSCGDGTRNTNTDDDTRGNREYNRENDMDNMRDRDMDNTRDRDVNRGTNQGADRDTIGQDL